MQIKSHAIAWKVFIFLLYYLFIYLLTYLPIYLRKKIGIWEKSAANDSEAYVVLRSDEELKPSCCLVLQDEDEGFSDWSHRLENRTELYDCRAKELTPSTLQWKPDNEKNDKCHPDQSSQASTSPPIEVDRQHLTWSFHFSWISILVVLFSEGEGWWEIIQYKSPATRFQTTAHHLWTSRHNIQTSGRDDEDTVCFYLDYFMCISIKWTFDIWILSVECRIYCWGREELLTNKHHISVTYTGTWTQSIVHRHGLGQVAGVMEQPALQREWRSSESRQRPADEAEGRDLHLRMEEKHQQQQQQGVEQKIPAEVRFPIQPLSTWRFHSSIQTHINQVSNVKPVLFSPKQKQIVTYRFTFPNFEVERIKLTQLN